MTPRTLKPRSDLPQVEATAALAWREGWFQGIAVGFVIGVCMAVVFLLKGH